MVTNALRLKSAAADRIMSEEETFFFQVSIEKKMKLKLTAELLGIRMG